MLYGAVWAFGVCALIAVLQELRLAMALALRGGGFLRWLARLTRNATAPAQGAALQAAPRLLPSLAGTFALTPPNSATILSFITIFGALTGLGVAACSALWGLQL